MKTSNWAAVTFLTVILTAVGMVWMGWFGSSHHGRASAANRSTQVTSQTKTPDIMDSQAAWRYRRAQNPYWKTAMCYHP